MINEIIHQESQWLHRLFKQREANTYREAKEDVDTVTPPSYQSGNYAAFISDHGLNFNERVLLTLTFVSHIQPWILSDVISSPSAHYNPQLNPECGFIRALNYSGWMPTGLTFLMLAGGLDTKRRLDCMTILTGNSALFREKVLLLEQTRSGDPLFSGRLILSHAYGERFMELKTTEQ